MALSIAKLRDDFATLLRVLGKATFRSPPKADVLIFDAQSSEILETLILKDMNFFRLAARGEHYYLSPRIMWRTLVNRRRYGARDLAYYAACIDVVAPAVVITYIDNSNRFHALSRIFPELRFLAVQNGSRDARDLRPKGPERIRMTDYYCFGQFEEDLYTSFGHHIERFHKIGSIRLSYYRTNVRPAADLPREPEFDICLISNFKKEIMTDDFSTLNEPTRHIYTYTRHSQTVLDEYLSRYLRERNVRFCVAGNRPPEEVGIEREFFERVYGPGVEFIACDKTTWTTFRAIENSRLAICYNSTAGFEALALGRKSMFANFTGTPDMDPPRPGPWQFSIEDYDAFARHLDDYLAMDGETFDRQAAPFVSYLFGDAADFSGYKMLADDIREQVGK